MQMKTIPIAELRGLLSAVSEHGQQHLVEVEADLLQTTFLLSAAIDKLSASFMAIHAVVTEQQQVLAKLVAERGLETAEMSQLESYEQQLSTEVDAAVSALQFQDMTSQLLTRTIKRVNGLKGLLQELSTHGNSVEPDQEHAEIARFLADLSKNLHAGSHALSGGLRRSVDQQHMDSGEIELF
jgi:cell division protein FtsB